MRVPKNRLNVVIYATAIQKAVLRALADKEHVTIGELLDERYQRLKSSVRVDSQPSTVLDSGVPNAFVNSKQVMQ